MAIWNQGGFFQELAEREQHLQWFPKAYVPAVKDKDGVHVVKITCNSCGKCDFCKFQKKCNEPPPPPPPPPAPPAPPKPEPPKCCVTVHTCCHHHHCC
ncbi:hypothetical protein GGI15_003874 [Coemansia interrupta]|uniref:Uncharacterized protein n=1 Tax=Coemansia interrupta TaxID=1126814 RepID=A0A9W8LFG6_9FUNG|nr:hypothetical protein GGI15_003874 [Coemansia interrupta]